MSKYYPTYKINPESIYGSGIVSANKFPHTDKTTSVITGSFPQDKNITPPIYQTGISFKPQDTNGYRILKVPYNEKLKLYNNYYSSQQNNKNIVPDMQPSTKEKIVSKIKKITNRIANEPINSSNVPDINSVASDIQHIKSNSDNKNNNLNKLTNDQINNLDEDNFLNELTKPQSKTVDAYGRNKKMWINDHYLYSLEPRYTSVVYPWRAYTWMYPVNPNTDNYYIDNINSSPIDPLIVSNDSTTRGNYQSTYLRSNMLKEDFEVSSDCKKNFNILYFVVGILILTIYFYKD